MTTEPSTPTAASSNVNSPVEPVFTGPPDCEHQEWTLGCERCFYEATKIAKDNIEVAHVAHEADINTGATMFGWYVVGMLADMGVQLTEIARTTLDLHQRDNALTASKNLNNVSRTIVRVCNSPALLRSALDQASVFVLQMQEALAQQKAGNAAATPSNLILTDPL